jgi:hypothetical protein
MEVFMCDYSLHAVAHRPAKVGDKLVSTRFMSTTTRGFMAAGEAGTAICVLPGTELAFEHDVECETGTWSFRNRRISERVARFRNVNQDRANAYHDALEFPSGEVVLLTELCEGQRATVLQLPVAPGSEPQRATDTPARTPEDIGV